MKYRKKPIEVEAFRLGHDPMPDWLFERDAAKCPSLVFDGRKYKKLVIGTPEGDMTAHNGDYIIRGVKGEIYPCKADIFEMTYEKVEG